MAEDEPVRIRVGGNTTGRVWGGGYAPKNEERLAPMRMYNINGEPMCSIASIYSTKSMNATDVDSSTGGDGRTQENSTKQLLPGTKCTNTKHKLNCLGNDNLVIHIHTSIYRATKYGGGRDGKRTSEVTLSYIIPER